MKCVFRYRFFILGFWVLFFANPGKAQFVNQRVFCDVDGKACDSASASFIKHFLIETKDSTKAEVNYFDLKGNCTGHWTYSNYKKGEYNGMVWQRYDSTLTLKFKCSYLDGLQVGDDSGWHKNQVLRYVKSYTLGELNNVSYWYPSGAMKRKAKIDEEVPVEDVCFDEKGKKIKCEPWNQRANFPGGEQDFIQFIQKKFKYPKAMLEAGESGSVEIRFVVEKDGTLSNFKIIKSSNPLFEEEALRVLKLSPKWIPGYVDGEPVRSYRILPISLRTN